MTSIQNYVITFLQSLAFQRIEGFPDFRLMLGTGRIIFYLFSNPVGVYNPEASRKLLSKSGFSRATMKSDQDCPFYMSFHIVVASLNSHCSAFSCLRFAELAYAATLYMGRSAHCRQKVKV
ncbi:MAG: hypothetical protein NWF14_05200 [Candidatus Bathyarchaeota archaeon]|nr:hypothetical protein [Candidatus Bathyarchaeota archaeon]